MGEALDYVRKHDFVMEQLSRYAGPKIESGEHVKILCPFHGEKTPSGSISLKRDRSVGSFYCFGCRHKATWNEVAAESKGMFAPFGRIEPKEEEARNLFLQLAEAATNQDGYKEVDFEFRNIQPDKIWRTISTNLLIELGGKVCNYFVPDERRYEKVIHFPVVINKKKRGFFVCRMKKHPNPSYSSYFQAKALGKPGWLTRYGLWPFHPSIDLAKKLAEKSGMPVTIVLVEGQRDTMRLYGHGVPAMCIFGTGNWSSQKFRLLEEAGVDRVILMMDGDPPGIEATEKMLPDLIKVIGDVKVIKLWKVKGSPYLRYAHHENPKKAAEADGVQLYDPGNMPEWIIEKLREQFFT
jgi:hypothetical protein